MTDFYKMPGHLYNDPHPIFMAYVTSGSATMMEMAVSKEFHETLLGEIADSQFVDEIVETDSHGMPYRDDDGNIVEGILSDGTPFKPSTRYNAVKYFGGRTIHVLGEEVVK